MIRVYLFLFVILFCLDSISVNAKGITPVQEIIINTEVITLSLNDKVHKITDKEFGYFISKSLNIQSEEQNIDVGLLLEIVNRRNDEQDHHAWRSWSYAKTLGRYFLSIGYPAPKVNEVLKEVQDIEESNEHAKEIALLLDLGLMDTIDGKFKPHQKMKMLPNGKGKLIPIVLPVDATNKRITWNSLDPDVATVSSTGQVLPISAGITEVIGLSSDGKVRKSVKVIVK